jgi:hypothetical protein
MSTYQRTHVGDNPGITKLYGERTAQINCQHLLPHIKVDSNILDVGCGPGRITSDFVRLIQMSDNPYKD